MPIHSLSSQKNNESVYIFCFVAAGNLVAFVLLASMSSISKGWTIMFDSMVRIGFLIFGVLMLLDIILPRATHSASITSHTTSSARRGHGTNYKLHFNSVRNSNCTVDQASYTKLKDGDEVVLQDTRLLRRCVKIERNGELVYNFAYWFLFGLLIGIVSIIYGLGLVKLRRE